MFALHYRGNGSEAPVQSIEKRWSRLGWILLLLPVLLLACAHAPSPSSPLVGLWREVGKTATVEFRENGTFKAIDNQQMAVTGRYVVQRPGTIRFRVSRAGGPPDVITATMTKNADVLTFRSLEGEEIGRFKRVP